MSVKYAQNTVKGRILQNLESGPKRYSELLEREQDSVIGYKKYLKNKIQYLKKNLGKELFSNDEDAKTVIYAYEKFIEDMPDDGSMNEFRSKLKGGHKLNDFWERAIHIRFRTELKILMEDNKIKKISRGLYAKI